MDIKYPDPNEVGIKIPPHLMQQRSRGGFLHALKSEQTCTEHLRLSFREGYRAGKLYLREVRRRRGILHFPLQGRIRIRSVM